jgi:hypothetical protein
MSRKEKPNPEARLVNQITFNFVGHQERLDDAGRLQVWEGEITGGITGQIRWWFENPSPVSSSEFKGGEVGFYAASWKIMADDRLLLAGDSAGRTVFPEGTDGLWDGHGVVTHTSAELVHLKGRKVYETGPVIVGTDPPVTFSGIGMFTIF